MERYITLLLRKENIKKIASHSITYLFALQGVLNSLQFFQFLIYPFWLSFLATFLNFKRED
jgi:hypothetical protein